MLTYQYCLRGDLGTSVLVYCTKVGNAVNESAIQEWPSSVSVTVNSKYATVAQRCADGQHVNKATLERPCDITSLLAVSANNEVRVIKPAMSNVVEKEVFAIRVAIVDNIKVEDVIPQLERNNKEESLRTVKEVFGDGEVVFSEMLVDLRDPLSFQRIQIPAKSKQCEHVQCFDAKTFFSFQKTAKNAKWKCFICNKGPFRKEDIVIDSWFSEILEACKGDSSIEKIEYFEDGSWKQKKDDDEDSCGPSTQASKQTDSSSVVGQKRKHEETGLADAPAPAPNDPASNDSNFVSLVSDDEDDAPGPITNSVVVPNTFAPSILHNQDIPPMPFQQMQQLFPYGFTPI
mmetsp:Transcript_21941/g.47853  ORF Transcript_21941/g.47853 Transcript_21941/m.47853 type:complete len:345 (+) Transcript_21941:55-1089(+)